MAVFCHVTSALGVEATRSTSQYHSRDRSTQDRHPYLRVPTLKIKRRENRLILVKGCVRGLLRSRTQLINRARCGFVEVRVLRNMEVHATYERPLANLIVPLLKNSVIPVNVNYNREGSSSLTRRRVHFHVRDQRNFNRSIMNVDNDRESLSAFALRYGKGRLNTLRAINVNVRRSVRSQVINHGLALQASGTIFPLPITNILLTFKREDKGHRCHTQLRVTGLYRLANEH